VIKHFVIFGMSIALVTGSIPSAATESPSDYEKSGASTALQSTTADKPPVATLPEAHAPETTRAPTSETNGQAPKAPLDPGNGNWDPPPVTAPTTQH
jgi:hypothetical protein